MADHPRILVDTDPRIALSCVGALVSESITPYGHLKYSCGESVREVEVCASVPFQFTINGRSHVAQANVVHKIKAAEFEVTSLLGLGGSVEVRLLAETAAAPEVEAKHTAQLDAAKAA